MSELIQDKLTKVNEEIADTRRRLYWLESQRSALEDAAEKEAKAPILAEREEYRKESIRMLRLAAQGATAQELAKASGKSVTAVMGRLKRVWKAEFYEHYANNAGEESVLKGLRRSPLPDEVTPPKQTESQPYPPEPCTGQAP